MVNPTETTVLVRMPATLGHRLNRAATAHGVGRPELIRGILDDVLPTGTARRNYDVALPGFKVTP